MAVEPTDYASTLYGEPRRTLGRHGYIAYFPAPIPRKIELPAATIRLLADAEASLADVFEAEASGEPPNADVEELMAAVTEEGTDSGG
jgi:hypothetical protein